MTDKYRKRIVKAASLLMPHMKKLINSSVSIPERKKKLLYVGLLQSVLKIMREEQRRCGTTLSNR